MLDADLKLNTSTDNANAPGWTFCSNHAHVLVCLAEDPDSRLRDVATRVGITERTTMHVDVRVGISRGCARAAGTGSKPRKKGP